MKAVNIIFGILMIIFGIVCVFTPLKTAFGVNTLLAILAVAYGIFGIISCIANKIYGIHLVFCILSAIFGIAVFFLPLLVTITNKLVARLVAIWIILQGIVTIISATQARKRTPSKKWILLLISGIVGLLLGCYAFVHPLIFGVMFAVVLGTLIGAYFIQSGISLAFLSRRAK